MPAFVSIFKFMYTSPTSPKSPKFPCAEGRRLQGPPFGALRPGLPSARLNDSQNDIVPFNKDVAYRCAECIGVPGTPTQFSVAPGANADDGPEHSFTYELPYEGLSGASWITQTELQRWHSDR